MCSKGKVLGEIFQLDAKAKGAEVAIGGWSVAGSSSTRDAPWFAVKLNRINAPWAFARGAAFRTIASLELLGVLVGVMVLMPEVGPPGDSMGSISLTCGTDNQGNMFLMDKLLTTKYPLGVVLMELSTQLGRRGASLRADWIPRLQNEEADALTNSDFRHFHSAKRIPVNLAELKFNVLNMLFESGDDYLTELAEQKSKTPTAASSSTSGPAKKKRKKKGDSLRDRDPW